MTDNLIICEHIGLMLPTIVYHSGERLETKELDIESLVKTWRDKWFDLKDEWIVLALSNKEYNSIQKTVLPASKSVRELLYSNKVICINVKDIQVNAVEEYCEYCKAENERFINELENRI